MDSGGGRFALVHETKEYDFAQQTLLQGLIIDVLKKLRETLSLDQLQRRISESKVLASATWKQLLAQRPLRSAPELYKILQQNPQVLFEDQKYSYKPEHSGVGSKAELEALLASHPLGLEEKDVQDCYTAAAVDIEELVTQGVLFRKLNDDTKRTVLYYKEFRVDGVKVQKVSPDVSALWESVEMPATDGELESKLVGLGHLTKEAAEQGHRRQLVATTAPRERQRRRPKRKLDAVLSHVKSTTMY